MRKARRELLHKATLFASAGMLGVPLCSCGSNGSSSDTGGTPPPTSNEQPEAPPSPETDGPLPPTDAPFQVGTAIFPEAQFQAALDALGEGDTLLIRGERSYAVTGVLRRSNVTLRAVGGKATLDGLNEPGFPAQGKALIVQQASDVTYEDIVFANVTVSSANGAGVRLEGSGTTRFLRCEFRDSDEGLLTKNGDENCHVMMQDCVGMNLGAGDGQSHGVYCGTIGSLVIVGGSWSDSNVGHLIKSRAARTRLENVRLDEGRASRALDVPAGGVVEILGSTLIQSQATNNSELIGYGFEVSGPYWPSNSLTFRSSNSVIDTRSPPGKVFSYARWFSGPLVIEAYSYNGSNANPPGHAN